MVQVQIPSWCIHVNRSTRIMLLFSKIWIVISHGGLRKWYLPWYRRQANQFFSRYDDITSRLGTVALVIITQFRHEVVLGRHYRAGRLTSKFPITCHWNTNKWLCTFYHTKWNQHWAVFCLINLSSLCRWRWNRSSTFTSKLAFSGSKSNFVTAINFSCDEHVYI